VDKVLLREALADARRAPEGAFTLTVERAGILRAYVQTRRKSGFHSGADRALCEKIERLLVAQRDSENGHADAANVETRRQQAVMRTAIDKILQNRWSSVTPDDVALLRGAYQEITSQRKPNERLRALLAKVLATVDAHAPRFENALLDAGDVYSAPSWDVTPVPVSDALPEKVPTRLSNLEGLPVDLHVRTYLFEGDTILDGDVSADVFLTVSAGRVRVLGSVSGHIVADGDIKIDENVLGGTLISRHGEIEAGRVMMGSTVVACGGSVHCERIEAPERAFAWDTIHVQDKALSAEIAARNVTIGDDAVSCTITSCGSVRAKALCSGARGDTVVRLQKELTCELWGRDLPKDGLERQRQVRDLQQQITQAEAADRYTHRMIQDCHRTALYYLLSGAESAALTLALQGKRTREENLRRILALGEGIASHYRHVIEQGETEDSAALAKYFKEQEKSIEYLQKDFASIPDELSSGDKRYAVDRLAEIHGLARLVHEAVGTPDAMTALEERLEKRLSTLRRTMDHLKRDIASTLQSLGIPQSKLNEIEQTGDLGTLVIHTRDKALASTPEVQQRARSPLIRLLLSSADRYARTLDNRRENIVELRSELRNLRNALSNDRLILFSERSPQSCFVEADRFDAGTVITASTVKKTGFDSRLARVIQLDKPLEQRTKFVLMDELIERID
jgi:hypothetical protein